MSDTGKDDVKIFTTCPASAMARPNGCLERLRAVAQWSEEAGCEGMLVFSDNRQLDPWLVSQQIIEATQRLCPLVAVQPAYMHPYSVAKMITSLAFLHRRRVYLNMVAGGFKKDLEALGDRTPHDDRYLRLTEFTSIVDALLRGAGPVSYEGRYYSVSNLKLTPAMSRELLPGILVSGSSAAGRAAADELGAIKVEYPRPTREYAASRGNGCDQLGIRIGIGARETDAAAWRAARARFPEDRKGQLTRKLATSVSDSHWHRQLAESENGAGQGDVYWLGPFHNYKAMCPYLVGSYDTVAVELGRYMDVGFRTFILDEPADEDDLQHTSVVFRRAARKAAAA